MSGFKLHVDENFHYEAMRSLGTARYYGSDIREQLQILPRIPAGDFDAWYNEWTALAERVVARVDEKNLAAYNPVTVRNTFFAASHYFFVAEFFLHGNWDDPRSQRAYDQWRKYFDIANAHLDIPGKHVRVPVEFGEVPLIVYRTAKASKENPRPVVVLGGGFDSNYEELMHAYGFDALERSFNVVIYEGPGQPGFLREQHVAFIHDWERVVTPVVDYIFAHSKDELAYMDTSKIGLLGMSLGGYMAARAAAFEPRLAAVMCIDGVYSLYDCFKSLLPDVSALYVKGDQEGFDAAFDKQGLPTSSTSQRWLHDHSKFSFQEKSAFKLFQKFEKWTLADGVAEKIKMPAFIGDAQSDIFFKGQPPRVAKAIGANATLFEFTKETASDLHCASGAFVYQDQQIFEWFARAVGDRA